MEVDMLPGVDNTPHSLSGGVSVHKDFIETVCIELPGA